MEGSNTEKTIPKIARDIVVGVLAGVVIDATIQALHLEVLFPVLPYVWLAILLYLTADLLKKSKKTRNKLVVLYERLNKRQRVVSYIIVGLIGIAVAEGYWIGIKKMFEMRAEKPALPTSTTVIKSSEPPQNTDTHGITDKVEATAKVGHPPKSTREPQPNITIIQKVAPYGLLAKRCDDIGNAIFAYVRKRNEQSPKDIGAHLDEYRQWLIENDVWFRANFYEAAKELQKDLGTNFKDPQLNELIAEYERKFASRQKEEPAYVRENAPMFHLSIEHIEEIGERFKYLANQLREMSR